MFLLINDILSKTWAKSVPLKKRLANLSVTARIHDQLSSVSLQLYSLGITTINIGKGSVWALQNLCSELKFNREKTWNPGQSWVYNWSNNRCIFIKIIKIINIFYFYKYEARLYIPCYPLLTFHFLHFYFSNISLGLKTFYRVKWNNGINQILLNYLQNKTWFEYLYIEYAHDI